MVGNMGKCNKDCINGCKHYKTESVIVKKDLGWAITNEFQGYRHYCDKGSDKFQVWQDKVKTEHNFTEDLDCYEPNEFVEHLDKMIGIAEEILEKIEK